VVVVVEVVVVEVVVVEGGWWKSWLGFMRKVTSGKTEVSDCMDRSELTAGIL
jgi:hypothetical protein